MSGFQVPRLNFIPPWLPDKPNPDGTAFTAYDQTLPEDRPKFPRLGYQRVGDRGNEAGSAFGNLEKGFRRTINRCSPTRYPLPWHRLLSPDSAGLVRYTSRAQKPWRRGTGVAAIKKLSPPSRTTPQPNPHGTESALERKEEIERIKRFLSFYT